MMFGFRDPFEYLECARCGCLQLIGRPADLARYYPSDYYSLAADPNFPDSHSTVRRFATELLVRTPASVVDLLGLTNRIPGYWAPGLGLRLSSRICDVGSGAGRTLQRMQQQGFQHLVGYDPYLEASHESPPGIKLVRRGPDGIEGHFDLIMLQHSFEHMDNPIQVLRGLSDHLSARGRILITQPVADSFAWRHYGPDWASLDPPRHLFVHTQASMRRVAAAAGLRIMRCFWDSSPLQFWASEQYRRDIPMHDPRSFLTNPERSIFTAAEIRAFKRRTHRLNRRRQGDSAGFVLAATTVR